jgi:hypothetical protein
MSDNAQAQQMPKPDPALKRLEKFVGTWEMRGHTLNWSYAQFQGKQRDWTSHV